MKKNFYPDWSAVLKDEPTPIHRVCGLTEWLNEVNHIVMTTQENPHLNTVSLLTIPHQWC